MEKKIREFLQKLNTAALASREATQTERAIRKIQYSLDNADKAQADARKAAEDKEKSQKLADARDNSKRTRGKKPRVFFLYKKRTGRIEET